MPIIFPELNAETRNAKAVQVDRAVILSLFMPTPAYVGRHRSN